MKVLFISIILILLSTSAMAKDNFKMDCYRAIKTGETSDDIWIVRCENEEVIIYINKIYKTTQVKYKYLD